MPQFPDWKRQVAAWTDAAQSGQTQVRHAVSDVAEKGRHTTEELTERIGELATGTRERVERIPRAVLAALRRRVNVLDLATKSDVEAQSKLGRNRVSFVLKEFLHAQQSHDAELRESLRNELHEELESFAAAIGDGMFAVDASPAPDAVSSPRGGHAALDDFLDEDDDDIEVLGFDDADAIDGSY